MRDETETIPPPDERQTGYRVRFVVLKLFFLAFFAVVVARLVQVQVVDAHRYKAMARHQYEQRIKLPALRGSMYDRNGNILVSNTVFVSFAADPPAVDRHAGRVATVFAKNFGRAASSYRDRLSRQDRRFVWLERSVRPAIADIIEKANLPGIVMVDEPKRLYHYDEIAGTLLGFTDVDAKGISGLEMVMNEQLKGVDGSVTLQRDGRGRTFSSADYPRVEPVPGMDVELTIDVALQAVVEEELRRGIERNEADGGLAAFMNPHTGEILALSVVPGVNPNKPGAGGGAEARNRVVTDMFEPGSVFKVVTAAAAYEHHIINPQRRFYAEKGRMKVTLGRYVRYINDTHPHEWLTFREGIEASSNIVMAKASIDIGAERLYSMARDFGFGLTSGVDMPGEVRGTLKRPADWSRTTLQTLSYGYEVAVTPLQILCAYAAVANGGVLMRPYVVSALRTAAGDRKEISKPTAIRRVVSEETAALLTQAFEGAVERGTAKDVQIPGIRIAGKTGTARKVVEGSYKQGQYTASFVGYFPVESPQVIGIVMMDNPRRQGYYGGITSGPIFRAIAERVVNGSPSMSRTVATGRDPMQSRKVAVPDVRQMRPTVAQNMLASMGLKVKLYGEGVLIAKQRPDVGTLVESGDLVNLVLGSSGTAPKGGLNVPDVRGMTIRQALNRLVVDDFVVSIKGSGNVTGQIPRAGLAVSAGTTVTLLCEPRPLQHAVLY